jgi:hypothetical protein
MGRPRPCGGCVIRKPRLCAMQHLANAERLALTRLLLRHGRDKRFKKRSCRVMMSCFLKSTLVASLERSRYSYPRRQAKSHYDRL